MEVYFRDAYGFVVRPEHQQRYTEYANIYKEEEQERSGRWADFLEGQAKVEETAPSSDAGKTTTQSTRLWAQIRLIERTVSSRVRKRNHDSAETTSPASSHDSADLAEGGQSSETAEVDLAQAPSSSSDDVDVSEKPYFPWKEKLESLVHGGLPMDLRGELWQAFVGVEARRVEGYYCGLLGEETNEPTNEESNATVSLKWKAQIEKDIPRTFPGHPSLDEDGRQALRRLLTAYARHNPSVGYCQAMNFFGGLLLLMMPEENAFWTLVGIIDDYFDGYYTEEMIDSQVDQLVFEELMHEKFPKLVNHLDYLGVQVAWITGPWFLSIFINMLPWESVLRLWDVLLFDGNRSMLFRTSLALMELYGPALVTTKDAGDAVTLLQSLAGSTFDSSELVLMACVGYQVVNESKLQELRKKHRPSVITAMEEKHALYNSLGSKGFASKLQSFKHDPGLLMSERHLTDEQYDANSIEEIDRFAMAGATKVESVPELKQQVMLLKGDLSKLLEEKRSLIIRAGELETAFMEMVKQDNRHILSAKIEHLEQEIAELQQNLGVKQEQESVMIQVLVRMEKEQKATEDARLCAERDAAAQKYAAQMLQEKYEETVVLLAEMERRAVMAESMLEATLHYQSYGEHQTSSTRFTEEEQESDAPNRRESLPSRPLGIGGQEDTSKGESSKMEDKALGTDEA